MSTPITPAETGTPSTSPGADRSASEADGGTHVIVVYSDDPAVRDGVRGAVGRRPARDLGRVEWVECTTGPEVLKAVGTRGSAVDLVVLDGEAWPTGGMGLAKQLKDEVVDCPPTLLLVARKADAWLADWSLADAVEPHPIDAPALTAAVTALLRSRARGLPARLHGG